MLHSKKLEGNVSVLDISNQLDIDEDIEIGLHEGREKNASPRAYLRTSAVVQLSR